MEETKKKELYAKMLEIAEKYKGAEIKNWRDDDKMLMVSMMSTMDKLVAGSPRTISTVIDDGSYMESEEGKKKLAELKKIIGDHPFTLESDFGKSIDAYLKPNNSTEASSEKEDRKVYAVRIYRCDIRRSEDIRKVFKSKESALQEMNRIKQNYRKRNFPIVDMTPRDGFLYASYDLEVDQIGIEEIDFE